ncbi:MAG: BspA family leucine-rich repeat surface protein [Alistipes sp.]|nr:BspA family leucine-rich repeat surface protein [Alistipes sp.]
MNAMKKMMKMSLTMALAALLAVGCQKDTESAPAQEAQWTTVTATINNGDLGRVAYEDDGTSVLKVNWKDSGEAFWVIGDGGLQLMEQIEGSTFGGMLADSPSGYAALYPKEVIDPNTFDDLTDFSAQNGVLNEQFNLMFGASDDGKHFDFQHRTAIIKPTFKVAGEKVNNQISQITLLDIDNAYRSKKGNITVACNLLENIYIYIPNATHNDDIDHAIYYAGDEIALTATIGGEEYTGRITVPEGRLIECGKVYPLGITLTKRPEVCNVPTFRYFVFTSITDMKYIKFVANSNINTKDLQQVFTGAYLYKNGEVHEFHTAAKKFVLPESCYQMFKGGYYGIDFNNSVDTSKVTDMAEMFRGCYFESIDLSCFDTSSLISIYGMFMSCTELKSIDLSNFVGANVTDMHAMFAKCRNLELIDLRNFQGAQTIDFFEFMYELGKSVAQTEIIVNSTFYNKFERYSGYTGKESKHKFTIVQ